MYEIKMQIQIKSGKMNAKKENILCEAELAKYSFQHNQFLQWFEISSRFELTSSVISKCS